MRGTLQIAKFFGIPVQVHWSFSLILVWVGLSGYTKAFDIRSSLIMLLIVLVIFVCVVLHEFGHALTARAYGINTKDIILLPIGGVARLDKLPEKPMQELMVALAGPLVNIGIALLLSPSVFFFDIDGNFINNFGLISLFQAVLAANLVLAIFNLIPAYPMDGGRILRALLALKLSRVQATRVASLIGQAFAVLIIAYSIFFSQQPMLALLGLFVFFTAMQEYQSIKQEDKLRRIHLQDIMDKDFTLLVPSDTIRTVVAIQELKRNHSFIVVNESDQLIGVLENDRIEEANTNENIDAPIMLYMSKYPICFESSHSLLSAIPQIQAIGNKTIPILEMGKVVGVIQQKMLWDKIKNILKRK